MSWIWQVRSSSRQKDTFFIFWMIRYELYLCQSSFCESPNYNTLNLKQYFLVRFALYVAIKFVVFASLMNLCAWKSFYLYMVWIYSIKLSISKDFSIVEQYILIFLIVIMSDLSGSLDIISNEVLPVEEKTIACKQIQVVQKRLLSNLADSRCIFKISL